MNILSDKSQCYGCGACQNVCPSNAISMVEDEEGFLAPYIDNKKCVQCEKCKSVCPRLNVNYSNFSKPEVYGIVASDEIRKRSSSGGAAMLLSQWVINERGLVCGSALNNDFVSAN